MGVSVSAPHGPSPTRATVVGVDPTNCACSTCESGTSVPLEDAAKSQVLALLQGRLQDNTFSYWRWRFEENEVVVSTSSILAEWRFARIEAASFTRRNHSGAPRR